MSETARIESSVARESGPLCFFSDANALYTSTKSRLARAEFLSISSRAPSLPADLM